MVCIKQPAFVVRHILMYISDFKLIAVMFPPPGGEDYKEINRELTLFAGRNRRCIPVIIFEDQEAEIDESFELTIEGMDARTTVIILDDDCMFLLLSQSEQS